MLEVCLRRAVLEDCLTMAVGKAVLESWIRRAVLEDCFRRAVLEHSFNRTLHQCFGRTHMKSNVVVNPGDCQDQWNQIELGLLVMALLVVILTTMCLANEIHWAHSDSWSSLATFTCALNIFQVSRKVTATNVLGTCTDFIWFQNSHLKIAPRGHPAEDEVQVTLIVVITVIVAIAGQELFIFGVIMKQFAVCGNILANCT